MNPNMELDKALDALLQLQERSTRGSDDKPDVSVEMVIALARVAVAMEGVASESAAAQLQARKGLLC